MGGDVRGLQQTLKKWEIHVIFQKVCSSYVVGSLGEGRILGWISMKCGWSYRMDTSGRSEVQW